MSSTPTTETSTKEVSSSDIDQALLAFDAAKIIAENKVACKASITDAFKSCAKVIIENCPFPGDRDKYLTQLYNLMNDVNYNVTSKEPNPFLKNNLTDRSKFMISNPKHWKFFMEAAGLSDACELHKV